MNIAGTSELYYGFKGLGVIRHSRRFAPFDNINVATCQHLKNCYFPTTKVIVGYIAMELFSDSRSTQRSFITICITEYTGVFQRDFQASQHKRKTIGTKSNDG